MPGREQAVLFRGRVGGERYKRHQPCPPAQQLDGLTIRNVRRLRQSLVRLRVVQTYLAIPRPPNGGLSPFWMLDQRATLEPLGERATVGLALATFLGLETMQLPVMPDKRSHAHQPFVIGSSLPSNHAHGPHPGINAVRFPHLSQLLARFLEAHLPPQRFAFVPLPGPHLAKLPHFSTKQVYP